MKLQTTFLSALLLSITVMMTPLNVCAYSSYSVTAERSYAGGESVTLTCKDNQGQIVWSYQSGTYSGGEYDVISILGEANGQFYLIEDGTLKSISMDYGFARTVDYVSRYGSTVDNACDTDWEGRLYFITWDQAQIYVIDTDGSVIGPLYTDGTHWHPFRLVVNGVGNITVTYENNENGDIDPTVSYDLTEYVN